MRQPRGPGEEDFPGAKIFFVGGKGAIQIRILFYGKGKWYAILVLQTLLPLLISSMLIRRKYWILAIFWLPDWIYLHIDSFSNHGCLCDILSGLLRIISTEETIKGGGHSVAGFPSVM